MRDPDPSITLLKLPTYVIASFAFAIAQYLLWAMLLTSAKLGSSGLAALISPLKDS